jgi:hypothetical protein
MQAKELELRLRQERALWRSAQLRRDVRQEAQCLAAPLAQVDRLREGLVWMERHPIVLAALLAGVVAITPRKALSKAARLWSLWRTVRGFRR